MRRLRPGARRRRIVARVLVGMLVLLVLVAAWLALGVLEARNVVAAALDLHG